MRFSALWALIRERRASAVLILGVAAAVSGAAVLGHQVGMASIGSATPAKHLMIDNPYAAAGSWYKGNLHIASARGLGRDLPSAIGQWYAAHGYAFLGISDMNTFTWTSEYGSRQLIAVPEVDASYPFGDLLAVGTDHWLPAASLQEAINWIADDGGLPVLAAPRSPLKPLAAQSVVSLKRLFALEIYDARLSNQSDADATGLWDTVLATGGRVYGFAGDDSANLADPATGKAWIEVRASSDDPDALLSSLRRGVFYASTGASFTSLSVSGRTVRVEVKDGITVRFIGRGGRLLKTGKGPVAAYQVGGDETYVRVEAIAEDGGRAWSQPFFLSSR